MKYRQNKISFVIIISTIAIGVGCISPGAKNPNKGVWKLTVISKNGTIEKHSDKKRYANGERITLIAHPDSGYSFLNWYGSIYDIHSSITFTMNGNKEIYAGYVKGTIGSVTDIDGFTYRTLKIGEQVWTIDNLRTTRLNDGTPIPHIVGDSEWCETKKPAYCFCKHSKDTVFQVKFGALYNWFAVATGELAPEGWRIATDSDWTILAKTFDLCTSWEKKTGSFNSTSVISANTDWWRCNKPFSFFRKKNFPGTNVSLNNGTGFSAMPGGFRSDKGGFLGLNSLCWWWTLDTIAEQPSDITRFLRASGYDVSEHIPIKSLIYLYCDSPEISLLKQRGNFGLSIRLVREAASEKKNSDTFYKINIAKN